METMETQLGKMETQLKQWGAKLDEIAAKAGDAGAKAKVDFRKRVDDLRAKHQAAKVKLEEVRAAGSEKWTIFKASVDSAWKDLEVGFKNLTS